jgi:hypothetical protein
LWSEDSEGSHEPLAHPIRARAGARRAARRALAGRVRQGVQDRLPVRHRQRMNLSRRARGRARACWPCRVAPPRGAGGRALRGRRG